MARPTSSGLPYLHRRADSGKLAYWRTLPDGIAGHVVGRLDLDWSRSERQLTGKKTVKVSLKTGDEATARERWGQVHAQVEALVKRAIEKARGETAKKTNLKKMESLSSADLATIAAQVRHDILAEQDQAWVDPEFLPVIARAISLIDKGNGEPFSAEEARRIGRMVEQRNVSAMLRTGEMGFLNAAMAAMVAADGVDGGQGAGKDRVIAERPGELDQRLKENGVEISGSPVEMRKLGLTVLRATAGALQEAQARDNGSIIETPPRPDPIIVPEADAPEKRTLRELHDEWVKLKRPGLKAKDDNLLYVARFCSLHGHPTVDQIKASHIRTFRDTLCKIPRAMPNAVAKRPLPEIVAWGKEKNVGQFLARGTVNAKGIGSISTLLNVAISEGYIEANPCSGLRLDVKPGDKKKRKPFSIEQLNRFFQSPAFQNPPKQSKSGGGAAAFWLPLIGLFDGAREEEIGQLLTSDVKVSAMGIPYLDLTTIDDDAPARNTKKTASSAEQKSLKSEKSKRQVPIHQVLIDLGFLDYMAARRARGDRRLFPRLKAYRGRYTKNWSRSFNRYLDKHVSDDEAYVFHSFRHTFTDALRAAKIERDLKKALLGHSGGDVTDEYGEGFPVEVLNEELQKIGYHGLDLTRLGAVAKQYLDG